MLEGLRTGPRGPRWPRNSPVWVARLGVVITLAAFGLGISIAATAQAPPINKISCFDENGNVYAVIENDGRPCPPDPTSPTSGPTPTSVAIATCAGVLVFGAIAWSVKSRKRRPGRPTREVPTRGSATPAQRAFHGRSSYAWATPEPPPSETVPRADPPGPTGGPEAAGEHLRDGYFAAGMAEPDALGTNIESALRKLEERAARGELSSDEAEAGRSDLSRALEEQFARGQITEAQFKGQRDALREGVNAAIAGGVVGAVAGAGYAAMEGVRVESPDDGSKDCPVCGAGAPPESRFCPSCGHRFPYEASHETAVGHPAPNEDGGANVTKSVGPLDATSDIARADDLVEQWAEKYRESWPDAELVIVDQGECHYLFDMGSGARAARVVGAWGLSAPTGADRDKGRMRGHPRPRRMLDDRMHLFPHAGGGLYDINLIPGDSILNRGRSSAGKRYTEIERFWASHPGTLMFIRPIYDDGTPEGVSKDAKTDQQFRHGRPVSFEVGLEKNGHLEVTSFDN